MILFLFHMVNGMPIRKRIVDGKKDKRYIMLFRILE
jgi:hypothetical protein